MRTLLSFVVAFFATLALTLLRPEPDSPVWTLAVGPMGAGFLAAIVVGMREPLPQDLVKAGIFTGIGLFLLSRGIPTWMVWPVIVGPWVGLAVNQLRGRADAIDS